MIDLIKMIRDNFKDENLKGNGNTNHFPIPKHLNSIFKPIGDTNTEFAVIGKIVCDCGNDNFNISFVGDDRDYDIDKVIKVKNVYGNDFLIVKVKCINCNKEHLIFDDDFHGWNGFICGDDSKNLERPKSKIWACNKCRNINHSLAVTINSQGQEDFLEGAGKEFDKNDWLEAFEWITINVECKNCGERNEEWISYETM
jgi:hypothetical protein